MNYKTYPTVATTPSRKQRKAQRRSVRAYNEGLRSEIKQQKKKGKREQNN